MKMVRNNETGVLFVATDLLLKRVFRESTGPDKGKWSVLEVEDKPETGGRRGAKAEKAKAEKPPKAEDPPKDDKPSETDPETGGGDEPKDTTGDTLAAMQNQLLAAADKAAAIEDKKEAKRALASLALENYAHKLDERKAVDTLHQELVALIKGEDA